MEEIGIVKETVGPTAIVQVQRQSACDKCASSSVCKSLGDYAEIEALNEAKARTGDTVKVSFRPYTYLKGTALIYGVPALFLIIGAVIGKEYLSGFFPQADPDIMSALGGFGLFAVTLLVVKLLARRQEGRKESMPVIEEIISSVSE